MAVDILKDAASVVEVYPAAARPSSATANFYTPGGSVKESPSVSIDTVGSGGTATISTVTSQSVLVVDDATGFVVGRHYWLESASGWAAAITISEISGTTLTLEANPPGTVAVSDTIRGLRCYATISAASTVDRDMNYRVEWRVTGADGVLRPYQTMINVVRMEFRAAITPSEASRYVAAAFPGYATGQTAGAWIELASRASNRVRRLMRATGYYPHLVGDQDAFVDAGIISLRIEIALSEGLVPPGYDPSMYIRDQEAALKRSITEATASAWVDRDADGAVDDDDVRTLYTMRAVRT